MSVVDFSRAIEMKSSFGSGNDMKIAYNSMYLAILYLVYTYNLILISIMNGLIIQESFILVLSKIWTCTNKQLQLQHIQHPVIVHRWT